MTGETLEKWLQEARIGYQEFANMLAAGGRPLTRGRVWQWCKRGDPISAYWQSRIEQVMAAVNRADNLRMAGVTMPEVPA